MKLYWVSTEDHDEDWFMVASSSEEAARLHQDMEGYDPGEAIAEEIMDIPETLECEKGWPDKELLKALGAKYLHEGDARVVEIRGRTFSEGMLESYIREASDDEFETVGEERRNKTKRARRPQ
ncbi:MAG: hypothetical protein FP816_09905 [Desulfobacteraceae bacterium]|nr:hypothetical protein [Desulfobacteraceae bacterium]MBU4055589.1 hypothetical protein [Pseudomonadota bacterium]